MTHKKITYTLLLSIFVSVVNAQLPSSGQTTVLDGVYQQTHIPTKRVISYAHLREADVLWSKRVWRTIETRERLNFPLFYPKEPLSDRMALIDVVNYAVFDEGSLTVYEYSGANEGGDDFRKPILPPNGNRSDSTYIKTLMTYFGNTQKNEKLDEEGEAMFDFNGDPIYIETFIPYSAEDIIAWEVKEDWFFDRQKSVMDVRIIGIAPIVYAKNENGDILGPKGLFWLYFPECRYVFQNFFVYNTENDAMRMSFDDLFWKRKFSSYIHKESNIYDRDVTETEKGINRLLMSEKIKEEMFKIEHDLWHY